MSNRKLPVIGSWYMTATGQLIKVWASCFQGSDTSRVVIEYLNGRRLVLEASEWDALDVEIHLYSDAVGGGVC